LDIWLPSIGQEVTAPQAVLEMVPRRRGFDAFWTAAFARDGLTSPTAVPLS